jgi:hypothetical protein
MFKKKLNSKLFSAHKKGNLVHFHIPLNDYVEQVLDKNRYLSTFHFASPRKYKKRAILIAQKVGLHFC